MNFNSPSIDDLLDFTLEGYQQRSQADGKPAPVHMTLHFEILHALNGAETRILSETFHSMDESPLFGDSRSAGWYQHLTRAAIADIQGAYTQNDRLKQGGLSFDRRLQRPGAEIALYADVSPVSEGGSVEGSFILECSAEEMSGPM